ncbi:MAG: branched-chain amino acid aminotransferase [Vicingaceae bacterium]|jgi:branched-chain amino acid aminotransferase
MLHGTHNAIDDPRNEDIIISINGTFHKRQDAKISVFDSGYLVGDGIWEGFRLKNGKLIFMKEHLDRLWQSAKAVHMKFPFTKEELVEQVWNVLNQNQMTDGVHVRLMVTRGIKKTPSQDPRLTVSGPNVVIIPEYKKADAATKKKGITLFTSTVRRGSPDYLDPRLNCHSKLHEVQALIQAIEAGYDEALMLDANGFVSTCNATNFFMVKNGEIWTSTGEYCMNGITRGNIIRVCNENGIPVFQKNFSLFEVYDADECFVTGSFGGVTPVTKIDGRVIENRQTNSMSSHLSDLYNNLVEKEIEA